MNKRNFNKLIKFLTDLPVEKYCLGQVVSKHSKGKGTVCCPVGWFPAIFKGAKWVIVKEHGYGDHHIEYEGLHMYDWIASEILGIPKWDARCLLTANQQHYINLPNLSKLSSPQEMAETLTKYKERYE